MPSSPTITEKYGVCAGERVVKIKGCSSCDTTFASASLPCALTRFSMINATAQKVIPITAVTISML